MIDRIALADRVAALAELNAAELVSLLHAQPLVAAALLGSGALAHVSSQGYWTTSPHRHEPTMQRLAELLGSAQGIAFGLRTLDRDALQLLSLAKWYGGALSFSQARAAAPDIDPSRLEAAAKHLATALFSDPRSAWVALRAGVGDRIGLPGRALRAHQQQYSNDELARILKHIGAAPAAQRKAERLDALEAFQRSPERVRSNLSGLSPDAIQLFYSLVSEVEGGRPITPVDAIGISYLSSYMITREPVGLALIELASSGLAAYSAEEQACWVWLDVVAGLNKHLFNAWSQKPEPTPQPLDGDGGPTNVLLRIEATLDAWAVDPPPALKTGGIGVRTVRMVAKRHGITETQATLLVELLRALGLVERFVLSVTGRGPKQVVAEAWRPSAERAIWTGLSGQQRWYRLAEAWLEGPVDENAQFDAYRNIDRHLLLDFLSRLPCGHGLAPTDLGEATTWRYRCFSHQEQVESIVEELRMLGLVEERGAIGLGGAARALLSGGPDQVASTAATGGASVAGFIVQPDHTVIADVGLDVAVLARLERLADLQSDAGVRIYRLSESRIALALADGLSVRQVVGFLTEFSRVPLPPIVARLVADAERRRGKLITGSARSWLVAEDPVQLGRAVAVKAAKLVAISSTVAVSELEESKMLAALRVKGLAPDAGEGPEQPDPARRSKQSSSSIPSPRAQLAPVPEVVISLAERLLRTGKTSPDAEGSDTLFQDPWLIP